MGLGFWMVATKGMPLPQIGSPLADGLLDSLRDFLAIFTTETTIWQGPAMFWKQVFVPCITRRPDLKRLHRDREWALVAAQTRKIMSKEGGVHAVSPSMQFPYLWHFGQWKLDLPDCTVRMIVPSQPGFTQGSPSRP